MHGDGRITLRSPSPIARGSSSCPGTTFREEALQSANISRRSGGPESDLLPARLARLRARPTAGWVKIYLDYWEDRTEPWIDQSATPAGDRAPNLERAALDNLCYWVRRKCELKCSTMKPPHCEHQPWVRK